METAMSPAPKAMSRALLPYAPLWNDVAHLVLRWRMLATLYATDQPTCDILNGAAPLFSGNLYRTLSDDVYGRICGLLDPAESGGRDKPCLEALLNALLPHGDQDLIVSLTDGLATLRSQAGAIPAWRKAAAHDSGGATALKTMPAPQRQTVDAIVEGIVRLLNEISARFRAPTILSPANPVGDDLVAALKKAVKLDEMFRASAGRKA
jgi:hypothetical protein